MSWLTIYWWFTVNFLLRFLMMTAQIQPLQDAVRNLRHHHCPISPCLSKTFLYSSGKITFFLRHNHSPGILVTTSSFLHFSANGSYCTNKMIFYTVLLHSKNDLWYLWCSSQEQWNYSDGVLQAQQQGHPTFDFISVLQSSSPKQCHRTFFTKAVRMASLALAWYLFWAPRWTLR